MWSTSPLILDAVSEILPEACGTGRVKSDHDVSLLGKYHHIPACTPCLVSRTLGATMNVDGQRISLIFFKEGGLYDSCTDHIVTISLVEEF
jgi:hypothetical protein